MNLYKMALIDEDFDMRELFLLTNLCKQYNLEVDDIAISLTNEQQQLEAIPESIEDRIKYLYELTQLAWADGVIQDSERALIRSLIIRYDFLEENVDSIMDYLIDSVKNGKSLDTIYREFNSED